MLSSMSAQESSINFRLCADIFLQLKIVTSVIQVPNPDRIISMHQMRCIHPFQRSALIANANTMTIQRNIRENHIIIKFGTICESILLPLLFDFVYRKEVLQLQDALRSSSRIYRVSISLGTIPIVDSFSSGLPPSL